MRTRSLSINIAIAVALAAMTATTWAEKLPLVPHSDTQDHNDDQADRDDPLEKELAPSEASPEELAAAPRADKARNATKVRAPHWATHLKLVPRLVLFAPRWTFAAVMWPIRQSLYAVDRYDLIGRTARLFSGDGAVTLAPSAILVAGQGVTYGVGVGLLDYAQARFLFGGEARQIYGGKLRSRGLLGSHFELDMEAELQLLRNSIFAGIGNASSSDGPVPNILIDPTVDSTSFETRYDQSIGRAEIGANWRPTRSMVLRVSGTYLRRRFTQPGDSDVQGLGEVYNEETLVTFSDGYSQLYGETRLTLDTRTQPSQWVSSALPTRGWKLTSFAGLHSPLDESFDDYARLGMDVQRYQHLLGGDRVLIGRAQLEWISAEVDAVPFVDLPGLGGSTILRGYRRGRFRDRISALAITEYRFPLHRQISGFLFLDGGKVAREFGDLAGNKIHLGAGIGLHVHTTSRLLVRMQLATSEEGIVVNASFSPSDRVRRTTKRR
jgi:hypothetical protein